MFGGIAIGVGTWLLLTVLGMGLGLRSDDHAAMASGAWSMVAALLAMFLGGYVASHLAHTPDSKLGALHGAVTWAVGTVLGIATLASTVGALGGVVAQHTDDQGYPMAASDAYDRMSDGERASMEREAKDQASKGMLLVGSTMLLSLAAAIGGGVLATRKRRNDDTDTRTTARITHVGPAPAAPSPYTTES